MTRLTDRDALVVLTHGSSNMAGWQAANNLVFTDDLTPTSFDNCLMWGRWNDSTNRLSPTQAGGPFDWESMTTTQNWQGTGIAPPYAIARRYHERYFSSAAKDSVVSAPKAVYFLNAAVSSCRSTQDTGRLAAAASFYPGSENVTDNPFYEVTAQGYWTEGLQALEDDDTIDNIYIDAFYYCGDESAALDPAGALADDLTAYSVAGGLSDLVAGTEFYIGVPQGSLPFVGVKPPLQYVENNNVSSTTAITQIETIRAQYDRFLEITPNPAMVVDGNDFALKSNEANVSHYTSNSFLSIGTSLYEARQELSSGPVLKTRDVRTAVVPINADE